MKDNQSVVRILDILKLIAKHEEGITLGDIYRTLGMSKSTAYDIVQTLYKMDAVYYKDPHLKNYVIGSTMFAIGSVYAKNSNLIEMSHSELKAFAEANNRVVMITKKVEDKIIVIYKYQPKTALLNLSDDIGTVKPFDEKSVYSRVFQSKVPKKKGEDIPCYREYQEDIGIDVIACPLYNFEQRLVGSMLSFDIMIEDKKQDHIIDDFQVIAKDVSRKLGFIEP